MKSAAPAMQGKLRRAWGKALVSRPAYAVNERRGIYIYICTYIYIDAAAPVFDVDIQASDIIVRSHRTICYENGTVYKGFVDVTTGLADGDIYIYIYIYIARS